MGEQDTPKSRHKMCLLVLLVVLIVGAFIHMAFASKWMNEKMPFDNSISIDRFGLPKTAEEEPLLPLSLPAADQAPYFLSLDLADTTCLPERICFKGTVGDDVELTRIKVVVRTTNYGFEVFNAPVSSSRIDLSAYCIENIGELLSYKEGEYEVVFTARDSADHVSSKRILFHLPPGRGCRQDMYGGQCVNYVRDFFGGQYDLMPGLCIYADCGAYHAWEAWDLGYGKGHLPARNSILILDKDPLLFGHVAVVTDYQKHADGTYTLFVNESNWDRDELIDCNVHYTYFPETSSIIRQGKKKVYAVAGFIYGAPVYSQQDGPPQYDDAALTKSVNAPGNSFSNGL